MVAQLAASARDHAPILCRQRQTSPPARPMQKRTSTDPRSTVRRSPTASACWGIAPSPLVGMRFPRPVSVLRALSHDRRLPSASAQDAELPICRRMSRRQSSWGSSTSTSATASRTERAPRSSRPRFAPIRRNSNAMSVSSSALACPPRRAHLGAVRVRTLHTPHRSRTAPEYVRNLCDTDNIPVHDS